MVLRAPTPTQRDDIALPLARILCRHLPMDAIGPDVADFAETAAALHSYVMAEDDPLISRAEPDPDQQHGLEETYA